MTVKFRYIIETPADFMHKGDPVKTIVEYHTVEDFERGHFGFVNHSLCKVLARDVSTGSTDNNAVEIHEGDIVEFDAWPGHESNRDIHSVIFMDGQFLFTGTGHAMAYDLKYYEVEVIGNVTQNPELVK
jgi:uncharacterized phage protein (TIGR01671 family)